MSIASSVITLERFVFTALEISGLNELWIDFASPVPSSHDIPFMVPTSLIKSFLESDT